MKCFHLRYVAICFLSLGLFHPISDVIADEGVGLIANQKIKSVLKVNNSSINVEGRMSIAMKILPEDFNKGVIRVSDFNVLYEKILQESLTNRKPRKNARGALGFVLNKQGRGSNEQLLKYDERSGLISGKLTGFVSYPQLRELAVGRNVDGDDLNGKNDDFGAFAQKAVVSVSFNLPQGSVLRNVQDRKIIEVTGAQSVESDALPAERINRHAFETAASRFPMEIYSRFRFENGRSLCLQPVRIRSSVSDASPTGAGLDFGLPGARHEWNKGDIVFNVRPWKVVTNSALKIASTVSGSTSAEESEILDSVSDDDCIEIFFVEKFIPSSAHGGGATWAGGTAGAQIISTDENVNGVDFTHLGHELGHVMNLKHPGDGTATRPAGTTGTLMCPSGFNNDNPKVNSQNNKNNVSNPLFQFTIKIKSANVDCTDDAHCGSC